ncbi:amino acid ABC transporter permease [Agrococcus casei]|nr:amino acid ABC transporter permease [Agrococcus casei]
MSGGASVLYDVPGPKAIARNRILGGLVVVVVLAAFAFTIFRLADSGQFSAEKWEAFTYPFIWQNIGLALLRTLSAFVLSAVGALVLGFLLAVARLSTVRVLSIPATVVTEVLRAIPVLVLMMLLYYGFGSIGVPMSSFAAVVIALIAYNGSVLAEVFRAGVESLPKGQGEAGFAIGMTSRQVMNLILMPQAVRAMMPVIIAQLVVTLKDTALGFVITYNELLYYARYLMSQTTLGNPIIPSILIIGAIYIILCLLLSWLAHTVQKRTSRSVKVKVKVAAHHPGNPGGATDTQMMAAQDVGTDDQTGHSQAGG